MSNDDISNDTNAQQARSNLSQPDGATLLADQNRARFEYGRFRGHMEYCADARLLERMYMGGGLQWDDEDRKTLEDEGRPCFEFNEIMPAVNAVLGYQIANRLDVSYVAAGGDADENLAEIISKVFRQISNDQHHHWLETQQLADGLIQRRGYLDVRVQWDENMRGKVVMELLDPLDVVPDPDAKSYDPAGWSDWLRLRWMTLDQIEENFGPDKRRLCETFYNNDQDWGDDVMDERRNHFGDETLTGPAGDWTFTDNEGLRRVRVIERQRRTYKLTDVAISPLGDVRDINGMTPEKLADLQSNGWQMSKRMRQVIHWTVTTDFVVLFDGISPYKRFTVIPFFPYFRRGMTRGMVDGAVDPQKVLNKGISQFVHIVNSAANSGWVIEEHSLTNMETEDLETEGAKSGLVVEYKKGSKKPEKITPNQVPTGIDRLVDQAKAALKENTVPDAMEGITANGESGVAVQSRQFAAQQRLAVVLDNLRYSRMLLAQHVLELVQQYYDDPRILRITDQDPRTGKPVSTPVPINQYDQQQGTFLNDLTIGEYDVVVSETPIAVTFDNSQMQQLLDLRKAGVNIPDPAMVKASTLTNKSEIAEEIAENKPEPDPLDQAKANAANAQATLFQAQASKTQADKVQSGVTSMFSATQAAQVIAQIPQTAPLADELLRSAGFVDQDAPPIVPEPSGAEQAAVPPPARENTDPLHPAKPVHPAVGADAGIEGGNS